MNNPSEPQRKRKQFTFYESFFQAVHALPKCRQLEVYDALMEYGLYGKEPEALSDKSFAVFTLVRPVLDSGRAKAARPRQQATFL